ncbi:MAG: ATP-binding cassette domain-containing protein [Armatimonadetes bacterium]|nr:ATP-binding cassette domain-containing protein [Armatimonadota bacterium]
MASAVIEAENVSKQFVLSGHRASDLRERLGTLFKRRGEAPPAEPFYALRDIGFTVGRGESVGIVGHNGSGKSTLLKMLSGILKSDTGFIRTTGRIGALIEVGAGFHPDLSGRENVFLNGSIMGLSRRELSSKFDAIVAFSGLEKFIDTPVKRYSSGMFMRLGFAIATHIDPEILLIDEVLAVGDTQFQNKCLKHLREFSANGGTVVFVSHAMGQVADLCERCLWLDRGRLLHDGATTEAVESYMALVAEREEEEFKKNDPLAWEAREAERAEQRRVEDAIRTEAEEREKRTIAHREGRQIPDADPMRGRILAVGLRDVLNAPRNEYSAGEKMTVTISFRYGVAPKSPVVAVDLLRVDGIEQHAFTVSNYDHGLNISAPAGESTVRVTLGPLALMNGDYRVRVNLFRDSTAAQWWDSPDDTIEEAALFSVTTPIRSPGVAYIESQWQVVEN